MLVPLRERKHLQFLPRMAVFSRSDSIVGQQPDISATVTGSQGILMFGIVEEKMPDRCVSARAATQAVQLIWFEVLWLPTFLKCSSIFAIFCLALLRFCL